MKSKWIEGEVSRREWNEIRGRFIESYLIYPNPKLEDGEWTKKIWILYLKGWLVRRKDFHVWEPKEDKDSRVLLHFSDLIKSLDRHVKQEILRVWILEGWTSYQSWKCMKAKYNGGLK